MPSRRIAVIVVLVGVLCGHHWLGAQTPKRDIFTGTLNRQAFSSTAGQEFGLALGMTTFLMPQQNLLLYQDASGVTSTMPGPGLTQRIPAVGPDEPLSILLTLGATIGEAKKLVTITLSIQGVTKKGLATLPLTATVGARSGPALDIVTRFDGVSYSGASAGHVTITALDLTRRSVAGSFSLTTQPGMLKKEPPVVIADAKFEIGPR